MNITKLIILLSVVLSLNYSCATEKTNIEYLDEHKNYWHKNKDIFIQLANKIVSIKNRKFQIINIMENDDGELDLITFPEYPVNEDTKKFLKEMMLHINVYVIKIKSNRVSFLGITSSVGNDFRSAITLSSAYEFFTDANQAINKLVICDKEKLLSKASTMCYIKLNNNWAMQHSIYIPN